MLGLMQALHPHALTNFANRNGIRIAIPSVSRVVDGTSRRFCVFDHFEQVVHVKVSAQQPVGGGTSVVDGENLIALFVSFAIVADQKFDPDNRIVIATCVLASLHLALALLYI